MLSSHIRVGLPLEKPRSAHRGGWRKWPAQPQAHREETLKSRLVRASAPAAPEAAAPEIPPPILAARPLSLLPVRHFCLLSVFVFLAVLLVWGLVRSNHLSVALSYEISALTREKLELQEKNRQLKTELTQIGSLGQLERVARDTLGLITPNQGQIVVIEP